MKTYLLLCSALALLVNHAYSILLDIPLVIADIQIPEHVEIPLPLPTPQPMEVNLTADKVTGKLHEFVVFKATVEGGTPPYTYYWWFDGDSSWTSRADNTYIREITRPGLQNMYLVVKDSKNNATQELSLKITVKGF